MKNHKMLIADDEGLLRTGLIATLKRNYVDGEIYEATNGIEAVEKASLHRPDLIFMDHNMPGLNGIKASQKILQTLPGVKIIMVTGLPTVEIRFEAFEVGISAFLSKNPTDSELVSTVNNVMDGKTVLPGGFEEYNQKRVTIRGTTSNPQTVSILSDREIEVFKFVVRGYPTQKIAVILGLSCRTVEHHRANLKRKTGANTPHDLIRAGINMGF